MNETLYNWTFNFHKVVRQQNSGVVANFILPYSAVYLRIRKWKNYWNRSTFAKVIVKIKVARFFMAHGVFLFSKNNTWLELLRHTVSVQTYSTTSSRYFFLLTPCTPAVTGRAHCWVSTEVQKCKYRTPCQVHRSPQDVAGLRLLAPDTSRSYKITDAVRLCLVYLPALVSEWAGFSVSLDT